MLAINLAINETTTTTFLYYLFKRIASQEDMMSIINKKAEITAEDYLDKIPLPTVCKWELSEEERLFLESYYY